MNANRITWVHVSIIGGVLMVLLGVGLFFILLKPLNEDIETLKGQVSAVDNAKVTVDSGSFSIAQMDAAKKALQEAESRRDRKRRELASLERNKRLPRSKEINIGNGEPPTILQRTMPRWLQLPRVLVQSMEGYAQQLARRHKVKVVTKFAVPPPSTNPDSIPRDIIARNLGGMIITGSFDRVMRWAQDWNRAPLLVSVDGLKCALADKNGIVEATASLTVYLFPTGQAVTTPGASSAGATPGGGGGMLMPGGAGGMAPPGMSGPAGGGGGNGPTGAGGGGSNGPAGAGASNGPPGK